MRERDVALAAAATFAFLTVRNGNRIAGVMFGPAGVNVIPPRRGRDAALALLHRLEQRERARAGSPTTLADALRRVRFTARRRGVVVLSTNQDWLGGIVRFVASRRRAR